MERKQKAMNYTDEQLKAALAKMLPDKITYDDCGGNARSDRRSHRGSYRGSHRKTLSPIQTDAIHASWQQRVEALAKVKGIEI